MSNIEELVKNGHCTGCGLCVSEAPDKLKMEWNEYGFIVPKVISEEPQSDVLKVCPFNYNPEAEVRDEDRLAQIFLPSATREDKKLGRYENTYAGYSIGRRASSSSGGVATYVFEQLLRDGIVDHLFVVKESQGRYEYQLHSDADTIQSISKTRYFPVTMDELFVNIDKVEGKIAISGVACFVKAIRLKQHYYPHLKEKIPFLVGIICGGWKSRFFSDFLSQKAGIEGEYHNQEYRIKDPSSTASDYSYGAFDTRDNLKTMKMSVVGDMWGTGYFKASACDFCTDVSTELADISLGDAWLPEYRTDGEGTSVIVTRTKLADMLITRGLERGELVLEEIDKGRIIVSQSSSFLHRQDAVKFRKTLAKATGTGTPHVRKRVLRNINFFYALVQIQRLRIRANSLKFWKQTKNVVLFDKLMKRDLKRLAKLTILNRKIRKLF